MGGSSRRPAQRHRCAAVVTAGRDSSRGSINAAPARLPTPAPVPSKGSTSTYRPTMRPRTASPPPTSPWTAKPPRYWTRSALPHRATTLTVRSAPASETVDSTAMPKPSVNLSNTAPTIHSASCDSRSRPSATLRRIVGPCAQAWVRSGAGAGPRRRNFGNAAPPSNFAQPSPSAIELVVRGGRPSRSVAWTGDGSLRGSARNVWISHSRRKRSTGYGPAVLVLSSNWTKRRCGS